MGKSHGMEMEQEKEIDIFRKNGGLHGNVLNDENMNQLHKQFMGLIKPGSSPIMGEFSRLKV
jgi:hypothetical protein